MNDLSKRTLKRFARVVVSAAIAAGVNYLLQLSNAPHVPIDWSAAGLAVGVATLAAADKFARENKLY